MVASPDDPIGHDDPIEALSDLGQLRQDVGKHLKLFRVEPVSGPLADRAEVENHNTDIEAEGFDYSLIEPIVSYILPVEIMMAVKIMIVEDDQNMLTTLEYNLLKEGYDVITAVDGVQAVETARSEKPGSHCNLS